LIKRETIDRIIDAIRIEEVVGDFVTLRKRGVNWLGLCPFHNEKTPSFNVNPVRGIFKCFGCGEVGDAIRFVMKHESYSYPEALRYLASRYHIDIEEEAESPEMAEERSEREGLMNLLSFAAAFFHKQLLETDKGIAIGLSYLREREFSPASIENFNIGYAPDTWDELIKASRNAGYSDSQLIKTGLAIENEGRIYDRYRGRVIFPIANSSGRTIGFGGRILGASDKAAKYINSPETELYQKTRVLYGLHLARTAISKLDNCFLVEGYTDVISMHQAGISNVVSSSGTSLTTDQARLIHRYTQNVTIVYDGDQAGIKASMRGIDILLENDCNVKVVLLPPGEDPDSFARKNRRNDVEQYISQESRDFITFVAKLRSDDAGDDPVKRSALVRDVMQSIALIPNGITRQFYTRECARVLKVDEQLLFHELRKLLRKKVLGKDRSIPPDLIPEPEAPKIPQPVISGVSPSLAREKEIIRLMVNYGQHTVQLKPLTGESKAGSPQANEVSAAQFLVNEVEGDDLIFDEPVFKTIFSYYSEAIQKGEEIPKQELFIRHEDQELASTIIDLISEPYQLSTYWEENDIEIEREDHQNRLLRALELAVLQFKLDHLERIIRDINDEIRKAEGEDLIILLQKKIAFDQVKKDICKRLGWVITW
jgi:DNA primase